MVYAESSQRGVNLEYDELNTKTKFNVYFSGGATGLIQVGSRSTCDEYISKAIPIEMAHLVILIANETIIDAASGGSIAVITASELSKRAVVHEVGHTFAGLGDEYVWAEVADRYPLNFIPYMANLDVTNDPGKVKWSAYLKNSSYNNTIGIFEGGYYRASGVYRPEANSVMGTASERLYFNAPSREAIVRRIYQIMNRPFDFKEFLKNDDASVPSVPFSFQRNQRPRVNDFIGIRERIQHLQKK